MNCLDYRRRLTIAPGEADPMLDRHRQECAACAAWTARLAVFESTLRQAMAVEPPSGLAERVLLRQATEAEQRAARRRRLALAAGIVLGLGLGLGAGWWLRPVPVDQAVLAHIRSEPEHLREVEAVDLARLNRALARVGGRALRLPAPVRFAGTCPLLRGFAAHIVLQGRLGPVTVMVLPHATVQQVQPLGDDRFQGLVLPAAGGAVAVVGEHGEPLEALVRQVISDFGLAS